MKRRNHQIDGGSLSDILSGIVKAAVPIALQTLGAGIESNPLYNNDVYNTGRYRVRGKKLVNVPEVSGGQALYNDNVYNTGRYRQRGRPAVATEAVSNVEGAGRKRRCKKGGAFDFGILKDLAKQVVPKLLDLGTSAIKSKVSGLGRRKRKARKSGASFLPIG